MFLICVCPLFVEVIRFCRNGNGKITTATSRTTTVFSDLRCKHVRVVSLMCSFVTSVTAVVGNSPTVFYVTATYNSMYWYLLRTTTIITRVIVTVLIAMKVTRILGKKGSSGR